MGQAARKARHGSVVRYYRRKIPWGCSPGDGFVGGREYNLPGGGPFGATEPGFCHYLHEKPAGFHAGRVGLDHQFAPGVSEDSTLLSDLSWPWQRDAGLRPGNQIRIALCLGRCSGSCAVQPSAAKFFFLNASWALFRRPGRGGGIGAETHREPAYPTLASTLANRVVRASNDT